MENIKLCKYCYVNEDGESMGMKLGHTIINGVNIWDACIYGDEGAIRISSDLKSTEKIIKLKYCPMCGKKFEEKGR